MERRPPRLSGDAEVLRRLLAAIRGDASRRTIEYDYSGLEIRLARHVRDTTDDR